jgi:DNA-directed RNA polymerase specialized sigma24 family protein
MNPTDTTNTSNASTSSASTILAPSAIAAADATAATNDNALPRRLHTDPRAMVSHREVVGAVEGTLVKCGVDHQDLRDGVAEVQCRALESKQGKPLPTTVEQWRALSCTIAKRMVITDRRREERRGRWHAGLCEAPDDHIPEEPEPWRRDPVETREYLRVLKELFEAGKMPEDGEIILQHTADGWSAKKIAKDLGLTQSTVKNRLMRMRRAFRAKLASLGMLVMMLLVAVLFAAPFGAGVGGGRPPKTAETLRHDALDACDTAQWRTCLDELDEARELDPAGDDAAEIRVARERAQRGLAKQEQRLGTTPRP